MLLNILPLDGDPKLYSRGSDECFRLNSFSWKSNSQQTKEALVFDRKIGIQKIAATKVCSCFSTVVIQE